MICPPPDTVPTAAGQESPAPSSTLAAVSGKVIYLERKECLYSNLLKVTLPDQVYVASTTYRFPDQLWAALRQAGGDVGPEWLLTSKRIISFRDLREHPWNAICNQAQECEAREWAESNDPDRRRHFVYLLNHCLRHSRGRSTCVTASRWIATTSPLHRTSSRGA